RGVALWASAPCTLTAVKTMPAAPVDRRARRLTSPEAAPSRSVAFLPMFPPSRLRSMQTLVAARPSPRAPLRGKDLRDAAPTQFTLIQAPNLDSSGGRVKTAVRALPNHMRSRGARKPRARNPYSLTCGYGFRALGPRQSPEMTGVDCGLPTQPIGFR